MNTKPTNPLFKIIIIVIVIAGLTVTVASFFDPQDSDSDNISKEGSNSVDIVTSIYPVYSITRGLLDSYNQNSEDSKQIDYNLYLLARTGDDAHSYAPTPEDFRQVVEADLFLYNGIVDDWAEDIAREAQEENVKTLKLTDDLDLLSTDKDHDDKDHDDEDHDDKDHDDEDHDEESKDHDDENHDHDHGDEDPHFWLDPQMVIKASEAIANLLKFKVSIDSGYYVDELANLDQQYQQSLSICQSNRIVVSHQAFDYLGMAYDLDIQSIAGLEPEDEPSPQELAELIEEIEEEEIEYVLLESQVDDSFASTLREEAGVEILEFSSLEAEEERVGYIQAMQENLDSLTQALDCQN